MQAPPELSEAEQIRLVLDGNDEAFRDLVRPYQRGLYLKALSIVRNEADAEVRSIFRQLNYGNADYDVRQSFVMNYVWSDAFRHLTSWGPNALVKGSTFSGTIFKHTGFPYSIWSSNETAALQGALFRGTSPATTTAVLANVVGTPNVNCGGSAAQLVNGQPNPCYNATNFADPTNNFGTQRRNQFRGPGYFDTDFDLEKSFTMPRWESGQFSIGARFFNLFHHPNFAFPNTNADSGQFGQITQTVSQPTTIMAPALVRTLRQE